MLDKSGVRKHLCLVSDLKENAFSCSPLSMILAMGLSYMAFIILRFVPFIPTFLSVFLIINGCWILSNTFLHLLRNDHVIFILPFLCGVIIAPIYD